MHGRARVVLICACSLISFAILVSVVLATPDEGAGEQRGKEAVSCLDGDETAFLQRLPNHELFFLGELVGVVPGDADGAPPTCSGGTLAPTSAEWESVVIESVRCLPTGSTLILRQALAELGFMLPPPVVQPSVSDNRHASAYHVTEWSGYKQIQHPENAAAVAVMFAPPTCIADHPTFFECRVWGLVRGVEYVLFLSVQRGGKTLFQDSWGLPGVQSKIMFNTTIPALSHKDLGCPADCIPLQPESSVSIDVSVFDAFPTLSREQALLSKMVKKLETASNYDPYWLVASRKKQVAVTIIPKVMCSSIRHVFNQIECGGASECAVARASRHLNHHIQKVDLSTFTRVIFLRDPFERLHSAYRNAKSEPKHFYWRGSRCPDTKECTFEQWVNEIARIPTEAFENEHLRPQAQIAQFDKWHYHFMLRVSSVRDQEFFWDKIVKAPGVHENKSAKNHSDAYGLFQTIRMETLHKIRRVYKQDFDLWEQNLRYGTPRAENETTLYDIYAASLS